MGHCYRVVKTKSPASAGVIGEGRIAIGDRVHDQGSDGACGRKRDGHHRAAQWEMGHVRRDGATSLRAGADGPAPPLATSPSDGDPAIPPERPGRRCRSDAGLGRIGVG